MLPSVYLLLFVVSFKIKLKTFIRSCFSVLSRMLKQTLCSFYLPLTALVAVFGLIQRQIFSLLLNISIISVPILRYYFNIIVNPCVVEALGNRII
jgi:hypothetical protein